MFFIMSKSNIDVFSSVLETTETPQGMRWFIINPFMP